MAEQDAPEESELVPYIRRRDGLLPPQLGLTAEFYALQTHANYIAGFVTLAQHHRNDPARLDDYLAIIQQQAEELASRLEESRTYFPATE